MYVVGVGLVKKKVREGLDKTSNWGHSLSPF